MLAGTIFVSAIIISAFVVTVECGSIASSRMSKSYNEYRYGRYGSHKMAKQTRQNQNEEIAPPMEFAPVTTTSTTTITAKAQLLKIKPTTTVKQKYEVNLNEQMVNNLINRGNKRTVLCSLNDEIIDSVKKFIKRKNVMANNKHCKGEISVAYSPLPPFVYKENNTVMGLLPSKYRNPLFRKHDSCVFFPHYNF